MIFNIGGNMVLDSNNIKIDSDEVRTCIKCGQPLEKWRQRCIYCKTEQSGCVDC